MNKILKRLELIKTSIDLDDEEIIELQITKLLHMDLNSEVKYILLKLKNLDYGSAAIDIENYIKKYTGVVEYIDTEVRGLRLELKALEKKLQDLSELKNEYLNDIDEFNTLYSIKLGDIIQKILKLQEELLQNAIDEKQKQYDETEKVYRNTKDTVDEIKKHIEIVEEILDEIDEDDEDYDELHTTYRELKEDLQRLKNELDSQEEELRQEKEELEDDPLLEEHEEAKANYEEYSSEYEDIKYTQDDVCTISNKEKQKLKKLFRKASRLCHPDLVADELKKQAHELMLQLNEAYSKKDIDRVGKILSSLEKGTGLMLASDSIDDKKILKAKISEFRENISDLEVDIEDIKQDDTFETIQNIEDLDEYFEEMYSELEARYDELKQESSIKPHNILDTASTVIDDLQSEMSEDLNYFSTTATAKEHNLKARLHLFDRLIELNLLYKDRDNKYILTTSGKKIGGKYKENGKGNIWVVWKEHSLDKIIEDLKENLGFASSNTQSLAPDAPEAKEELSKITISDLPINEYEECLILIKEVGKTYIVIELNSDIYKISKPKNTTWTSQEIYTGMACIVEKTFYGNRNQYCKLNLIKTVKNPQMENENNVVYTQAPLKGNQKEIFKKITKQIEDIIETDMVWDNMLALVGAAGTGKTFLLTEVIKFLQNDYDITVTAPTHKALSVINQNLYNENLGNIATKTIHSFLNIKLFNDYKNGTQKFMPDKSVVDKSTAELLIVDEASMISDDIFKYIEDTISDGRVKCVLLVGDPYQLLPIDDSQPILSKINHSYELTQIVRQAEDSYIIHFATKIRDIIETQDYQDLNSFVKNNLLDDMEVLATYTDMYDDFCANTSWEDENKVIGSYTNKNVDSINKIIRNRYWSQQNILDPENIRKGDKLILSDGSQIVVKEVNRLWIKDSGIYYWECEDDEFVYNIIDVDSINTYENKLTSMASIAKSEENYKKRRKLWDEFFDFKDRFIEAKYSFSSTIHKLQGSTCETIYIDVDSFNVSRDMDTIYRLFYVAVTRASHNVKLKIQA